MGTCPLVGPSAPCASPARSVPLSAPQRKLADLNAVERRRLNRAAARAYRDRVAPSPTAAARRRAAAEAKEQLVVARLLRRFIPFDQRSRPLFKLYAYWQARRCGWDVMKPDLRYTGKRDGEGEPVLLEPEDCPTWLWWSSLHWKQRYMIAGGGRFVLKESRQDLEITHPNFEVVGEQRVA